jgi:hypothetical protein
VVAHVVSLGRAGRGEERQCSNDRENGKVESAGTVKRARRMAMHCRTFRCGFRSAAPDARTEIVRGFAAPSYTRSLGRTATATSISLE